MSRRLTVMLTCNSGNCDAVRQGKPDQSIDELRQRLADVGWMSDKAIDLDLCPTHVEDIDAYYQDAFR